MTDDKQRGGRAQTGALAFVIGRRLPGKAKAHASSDTTAATTTTTAATTTTGCSLTGILIWLPNASASTRSLQVRLEANAMKLMLKAAV